MRKLKEIDVDIKINRAVMDAEVERVQKWERDANRTNIAEAQYFAGLLEDYARREREENERKTISTPYGTVKSRQLPAKLDVDEATFLAWAQDQCRDDLLTFADPKPNKTEIKKAIKAGQNIAGVVVNEGGVSFSIEVAE